MWVLARGAQNSSPALQISHCVSAPKQCLDPPLKRADFDAVLFVISYSNQRLRRSGLQSAISAVEAVAATASDEVDRRPTVRGRRGTEAWSPGGEGSRHGRDPLSSRSTESVSTMGGGDGVLGGCRTEEPRRGGGTASAGGGSSNQTAGADWDEWIEPKDWDLASTWRRLNMRDVDATIDVLYAPADRQVITGTNHR